jgi:type II secretory pathway component GspD/PulD (secretin)
MIRFLLVVLFCFFFDHFAFSAPAKLNMQLDQVKLVELVRVLYTDILKRPYVLDTDVLNLPDSVTVDMRNTKPEILERLVLDLLSKRDFSVVEQGGVTFISKRAKPEFEPFAYRPSHRSVSYLLDVLQPLFPAGAFSGQRAIPNPMNQPSAVAKNPAMSGAGSFEGQDQGLTATSFIDRSDKDVMVFSGSDNDRVKLQKLLKFLDVPPAELMIKAVVYEVQRSSQDVSAVDLALGLLSQRFGLNLTGGASTKNAASVSVGGVSAVFTALATDSRFKSLSQPSLRVKDGQQARFTVGSDVPVLGAIQYQSNGQSNQSVDYKSSGVIFQLTPKIHEQGSEITIFQQLSDFVQTTTGVNTSPTLNKRELQTTVQSSNDDVIILGGLQTTKDSSDSSMPKFLPDFLHSKASSSSNTEVLLVMQVQRI